MNAPRSLKLTTARAGPLTVRIVDGDGAAGASPAALVVLCHGYGAPGTDLVGIAAELCSIRPELAERGVRFAFPEAPLELEDMPFEGRAWWQIDVGRFAQAAATGNIDAIFDETPPGMPEARKALHSCVDELVRQARIPWSRVVLGGFSQGAMVTTDLALRLEDAPQSLVIMSGTLLCRPDWTRLAPTRRGLRVLQSHGTMDPLLPFAAAQELRKLMEGAGLAVDFVSFRGGHGIDHPVLDRLARMIRVGSEGEA